MGKTGRVILYCLINNDNNEVYDSGSPHALPLDKDSEFPKTFKVTSAVAEVPIRYLYGNNKDFVIRANTSNGTVIAQFTPNAAQSNNPGLYVNNANCSTSIDYSKLSTVYVHDSGNRWNCQLKQGEYFRIYVNYEGGALEWPSGATCYVTPTASPNTASLIWTPIKDDSLIGYEIQYTDDDGANYYTIQTVNPNISTFTVNVPSIGKTRWFRVVGLSSDGADANTAWLNSTNSLVSTISNPTAPTSVTIRENPAEKTTVLSWSGMRHGTNNNIASYTVEVQDDSGGWNTLTTTTWQACDVEPPAYGVQRQFRVRCNGTVEGTASGYAYSTYLTRAQSNPGPVTSITFDENPTANTTIMRWSGATPGTNNPIRDYTIQYKDDDGSWQDLVTTTDTSMTVTAPAVSGKRLFRIRTNGTLTNTYSAFVESEELTRRGTAPSTPTNLTFDENPATYSANFSWDHSTDGVNNPVRGYKVEYREDGGEWQEYTVTTETTLLVDPPDCLVEGQFRVKALGTIPDADSEWAESPILTRYYTPPTEPADLAYTVFPIVTTSELTWTASLDGINNVVDAYEIQYRDSTDGTDGEWQPYGQAEGYKTSFTVTGPTSTPIRFYRIRALGTVKDCNSEWVEGPPIMPKSSDPTPPFFFSFDNNPTDDKTILRWSGQMPGINNDIAGYSVQYSDDGTTWNNLGDTTTDYLEVSAPDLGKGRIFRVLTKGAVSNSMWSNPSDALTKSITNCTEPLSFSFSANPAATSTLSWTGQQPGTNNPIKQYAVQYKDGNGEWQDLTTVTSPSMTVSAPTSAVTRYFRVKTIGQVDGYDSGWSQTSTGLTWDVTAPSVPSTPTISCMTVRWGTSTNGRNNAVKGYELQSSSDGVNWTTVATTSGRSATSTTVSDPGAGRTVVFRVRALGTVSGIDSGWSGISAGLTSTQKPVSSEDASPVWKVVHIADLAYTPVRKRLVHLLLFKGDSSSHTWKVTAKDHHEAFPLTGYTITGTFSRADGTTYTNTGSVKGNIALCDFPANVSDRTGWYEATLTARKGTNLITLDHITFQVQEG